MPNVAISPLPEDVVDAFAEARAQHHIRIKSEHRMDNLSSFICGCGTEFLAGNRTPGDIDRHLAEVFATVLTATTCPTESTRTQIHVLDLTDINGTVVGSRQYAPMSTMALAIELHQSRAHSMPVSRYVRWLCTCQADAVEISKTRWLQDVQAVDTETRTEERLREITKAAIDRRPYDDRTRREIRGLENVIARDIAFELSKES